MKPTLEEVKAKFKNAKEVRCLVDRSIYDISKNIVKDVYWTTLGYYIDTKGTFIKLWSPRKGYAEIISYIEPEFTLTKEEILKLANQNSWCKKFLNEKYPEIFEESSIIEEKHNFAIKFADWVNLNAYKYSTQTTTKQLLEIYTNIK